MVDSEAEFLFVPAEVVMAVASSGLGGMFRHVLSVDAVQTYKPSPEVYALGPAAFGWRASEILYVSSNAWDVAGAKAYGYVTCWCNRLAAPMDALGADPDYQIERLDQLLQIIDL